MPVRLVGSGSYFPSKVVTNEEICRRFAACGLTHTQGGRELTPDFIFQLVGIKERREAEECENTSDLAAKAVISAIQDANESGFGIDPGDLDILLVGSSTPELIYPPTASLTQAKIRARKGIEAYDISYACTSGVVAVINTITRLEFRPKHRYGAAVGAETILSCIPSQGGWKNINANLWGDGAGCLIFEWTDDGPYGYLGDAICTDGYAAALTESRGLGARKKIRLDSGEIISYRDDEGKSIPFDVYLDGKKVHKYAIRAMAEVIEKVMIETGINARQINIIHPHQANQGIIEKTAERLGMSIEMFYIYLEYFGNTSAASPLTATDASRKEKRFTSGDIYGIAGAGGGMGSAAILLRA